MFSQTVLEPLILYVEKQGQQQQPRNLYSYTAPYTKMCMSLNRKYETLKFPEENIGEEKPHALMVNKHLLD